MDHEKPVTEAEAADYLGIAERTLRKYRYGGIGPPHATVGRTAKYLLSLVEEWLRAGGCARAQEASLQRSPRRASRSAAPVRHRELPRDERSHGHPDVIARRKARANKASLAQHREAPPTWDRVVPTTETTPSLHPITGKRTSPARAAWDTSEEA